MPELTDVEFQFYKPDGTPLADTVFSITLKRSGFITEAVGVVVPDVITATTDAEGKVVIKLHPSSTPYFLQLPADAVVDEDCCSNALARYKFYVPEVAPGVIVRAQDLFIAVAPSNVPYDEEAILIITEAKLTSVNAAREALASAVRAETAAVSIEGDADRAEAARDAAEASKNAAAGSAQASANSAAASSQSAADALASKNAAANSANAANNSAVSASNDAGRAAASATAASASKDAAAVSATAASGSATTATNAANSATASKDAAAASATTASTKAGEASTSAGNALTQANRAKTEADRATAATDGKQDKNDKLTALSGAGNVANPGFPVYSSNTAATMQPITDEALLFVRQPTPEAMGVRLDLVRVSSLTNVTSGRLVTPGWQGLGSFGGNRLPNATAQVALPSGDYCTQGTWEGSPYPGTDVRNQGILTVKVWDSVNFTRQIFTPLRRSDGPSYYRNSYNGGWLEWQMELTGNTSTSMAHKLDMRNVLGIGVPYTFCSSIDAKTKDEGVVLGYSYVNQNTVGTKPGGYVYGIVNTVLNEADHLQQDFVGLNGIAGTTQRAYRRSGYGNTAGAWGAWRLIIDSGSITNNVEDGGVVSQSRSAGVTQTRFASGLQITNGNFGQTPVIAVGAFTIVNLTIPFNTGPDTSYTTVAPIASPFVTNDWYGITNAYMSTPTNLQLVVRNGTAGEQAFGIRGAIIGYWK